MNLLKILLIITVLLPANVLASLVYKNVVIHGKQTIHTLQITPQQYTITLAQAKPLGKNLKFVSRFAKDVQAVAAINAGYFSINEKSIGLPAGILKIKNKWLSIAYAERGALAWNNSPPYTASINRVQTKTQIIIDGKRMPLTAVNRPLTSSNSAVLYNDEYPPFNNINNKNTNIFIKNNTIINISSDTNKIIVPIAGYVYSIGKKFNQQISKLHVGNKVTISIDVMPQILPPKFNWQTASNILGAGPLLIINGKVITDFNPEKISNNFIYTRHSRTAVGILANGDMLFAVTSIKTTLTIPELADFMRDQDCIAAINLDGGSSTSLFVQSNDHGRKKINFGKFPVANVMLVVPQ